MAPEERSDLTYALETGKQELDDAVAGIPQPQENTRPAADRWSALECLEHVIKVEERFVGLLENAARGDAPRIDKRKEVELTASVLNRQARGEAPEPARPTGRFATLSQALDEFHRTRARSLRIARERADELYYLTVEHPRRGTLNGAEMLLFIASHGRRHAQQLLEIKAALTRT